MTSSEKSGSKWGMMAALGTGLLASACCIVPLLLVTLGVGGAWVSSFTALEPYRPFFIGVAVAFLAWAGFREYRATRGPACDCEVTVNDKIRRALLVVGTLATLALIASPSIIKGGDDLSSATVFKPEPVLEEVALDVDGMTCETCPITVRKVLTRLDGVDEAKVSFDPPVALVKYDPQKVSLDDMMRATANVGYPARPQTVKQGVK